MNEWIPITEQPIPSRTLCIVFSTRTDDEALDGIDQFEGVWAVHTQEDVTEEFARLWARRHQVTHWMPLPLPPSTPKQGEGE